jgi:predicted transcriptional regulator
VSAQVKLFEGDLEALRATKRAIESDRAKFSKSGDIARGWLTATEIIEFSGSPENKGFRIALNNLASLGFLEQRLSASIRNYRLTEKGRKIVQSAGSKSTEVIVANSAAWTGVVEAPQIRQVLLILEEMEHVCEKIRNNQQRAQIIGLIRALEMLLAVPEPPRQGIVSLVRDPAFANIVQVGTFLAAIVAAVRA